MTRSAAPVLPAAHALLLAAGAARRFGGGKLTTPFHGRPLLTYALDAIRAARSNGTVADLVLVARHTDEKVGVLAAREALVLIPPDLADEGVAASLRAGLAELQRRGAAAAVVLLGDQPLVRADTISALVEAWRKGALAVRPRYAGDPNTPGHPVLLDRGVWPAALGLHGDAGLSALVGSGAIQMQFVDVPGVNPDIDTPDDLLALEEWT